MILSKIKKNKVLFSHCTFEFQNPRDSLIYYVRGDNSNSVIKVSDCTFIGELEKGLKFIDGQFLTNNSPKLIVDACKFTSSSKEGLNLNQDLFAVKLNNQVFNYKYSHSKELNQSWKSLTTLMSSAALIVVLGVIIVAFFIKKRETSNNNNEDLEMGKDDLNQSENQA